MIPDPLEKSNRIRANQVRVIEHPVLMGGNLAEQGRISVTPVLEGDCIRYFRIQCACGQTLEVECLYPELQEAQQGTQDIQEVEKSS